MLLPYLRLARAGLLASPAADVVAGLCVAGEPWSVDATRAVVASVLLYAAGMVLNDHADREEDGRLRPERPIPSGQVSAAAALTLGLVLLVAAIALSPAPLVHGAMGALVLAYDYVVKRRALFLAPVVMGLLRGTNLLVGVAAVAPAALDLLPLRLAACAYGVAIAGITVAGILEDARRAPAKAVRGALILPPLAATAGAYATATLWPAWLLLAVPALWFVRGVSRPRERWTAGEIRGCMRWLLLGTMLFDAVLCAGVGRWIEAVAILAIVPVARRVTRRIAAT